MAKWVSKSSGTLLNYLLLGLLIASIISVAAIPYFFPSPGQVTAMVTTQKGSGTHDNLGTASHHRAQHPVRAGK
jgi:hypothetical protein